MIEDAEAYGAACSALPRSGGLYPVQWNDRDVNAFFDQFPSSGRTIRVRLDQFDIKCGQMAKAESAITCEIMLKRPAAR